jgi:hypothetical protein
MGSAIGQSLPMVPLHPASPRMRPARGAHRRLQPGRDLPRMGMDLVAAVRRPGA